MDLFCFLNSLQSKVNERGENKKFLNLINEKSRDTRDPLKRLSKMISVHKEVGEGSPGKK